MRNEIARLRAINKKREYEIKEQKSVINKLKIEMNEKDLMMNEMKIMMNEMNITMSDFKTRLGYYENPHTPPSHKALPAKNKGQNRTSKKAPAPVGKKLGQKPGHVGVTRKNKIDRTVRIDPPSECKKCGSANMKIRKAINKIITDLIVKPKTETVNHIGYECTCRDCGAVTQPIMPGVFGTEVGIYLATIVITAYVAGNSRSQICNILNALGYHTSKASVYKIIDSWTRAKFVPKYNQICKNDLPKSDYFNIDETGMPINGKPGYVWIVVGMKKDVNGKSSAINCILIYVNRSRGGIVLDIIVPGNGTPVTADGYTPYKQFPILQRCWAHILREAEDCAKDSRQLEDICTRLKLLYHWAKEIGMNAELNADLEQIVKELEIKVRAMSKSITDLGHKFGTTLENATPYLFTFMRHPGMEPTNNVAERSLRPVVMTRKIRQGFRSAESMKTYGIVMTCALTWKARGYNMADKLFNVLEAT